MTEIAVPTTDLLDAWLDCVADFGGGSMDGSGDWQVPGLGPDRSSFDALLEAISRESDTSRDLPDGHVHSDYYWITDGADEPEMLGFIAVRHSIDTEFLRTLGGHIGYSIRPSRRRQGHASRALGLALVRARELGLDRTLLTCDIDNVGSARTIESQGGVFESVLDGKRRYSVDAPGG